MKKLKTSDNKPSILGGPPCVHTSPPHFTWPAIGPEEESAVLDLLRRKELSLYRRTGIIKQFEDAFARMHNVPFAMSTNSGTAALHAAYFGLDLTPGDEVIVPTYTHLATALPMLHVNLIPVLCDVQESTGNIDPARIEALISPRVRAITVTHQYGHLCNMDEIKYIARRNKLYVIEDCSHSHGAKYKGCLAGTFGDVACFSLQSNKAVVAGEGGILITKNPRIFERAALLSHFRQKWPTTSPEYEPFVETGYGLKSRLHPLGAAIALEQLKKLPTVNTKRQAHLTHITNRLDSILGVYPSSTSPHVERGGFFRFIFLYKPEELYGLSVENYIEALKAEGVVEVMPGSLVKPLHLTRLMQTLDDKMYRNGWPRRGETNKMAPVYKPGDFPVAERFSALTLQLPAFTYESKAIVDEYCTAMAKISEHAEAIQAYFASR